MIKSDEIQAPAFATRPVGQQRVTISRSTRYRREVVLTKRHTASRLQRRQRVYISTNTRSHSGIP